MKHIEMLLQHTQNNGEHKTLSLRAFGQFYTPELIGRHIVHSLLKNVQVRFGSTIKLIDPFCGDGRLVYWLIQEIASDEELRSAHLEVDLWDYNADYIKRAERLIDELRKEVKLSFSVNYETWDSFTKVHQHFGQFDLVITNPSWENIKPDRRELSSLSSNDKAEYISRLKAFSQTLSELYPESQPEHNFSGSVDTK